MKLNREAISQLPRAEQIEVEENIFREDLTESEKARLQRRLLEAVRLQSRPGERRDITGETMFSPVRDRATAQVAFDGESHKTVERRLDILAAAETNPAVFGDLLQQMDENSVGRAHELLRIRRAQIEHVSRTEQGGTVDDLAALAESGFRAGAILADPPWPDDGDWGPSRHYQTMSVEEIAAVPVAALVADSCLLILWVHSVHLALGNHVPVIRAWGFEPKTIAFSWPKRNASGDGYHCGLGNWTRHGTEVAVLGVKGSPLRLAKDVHEIIDAPIGPHSAKPAEVRRRIERLVPGLYLELFGREPVIGWIVWGNEIARSTIR